MFAVITAVISVLQTIVAVIMIAVDSELVEQAHEAWAASSSSRYRTGATRRLSHPCSLSLSKG